jgi:hypothetical protein
MALSLGAQGTDYLEPGQFQSFVAYRWLTADRGYVGPHQWSGYRKKVGVEINLHSIDVNLTYALTKRYSLSLTTPFIYGEVSSRFEHGGDRHSTHASGLGDVRLTANAWVFDPDTSGKGNISLSLGVKAPTGDDEAKDAFYRAGVKQTHPVDIGIQPGDGGWGLITEMQSFRGIFENTYVYATGFYLANPREENGANTQVPVYGRYWKNSVADQYQARAGLSYAVWPHQGLAVSLGARIDGIPQRDLIGSSGGWRRPGYEIYVEPGLILSRGKNAFSVYVPVAVQRNRQGSVLDDEFHGHGAGAFADYLVLFSASRKF